MYGLCVGIAVSQIYPAASLRVRLENIRINLQVWNRPCYYTREDALELMNNGGFSARYYRALDACPLRMS